MSRLLPPRHALMWPTSPPPGHVHTGQACKTSTCCHERAAGRATRSVAVATTVPVASLDDGVCVRRRVARGGRSIAAAHIHLPWSRRGSPRPRRRRHRRRRRSTPSDRRARHDSTNNDGGVPPRETRVPNNCKGRGECGRALHGLRAAEQHHVGHRQPRDLGLVAHARRHLVRRCVIDDSMMIALLRR